ncbi:MAG: LPS export ABC transporter permease LptG [Rhodocyclaceae bacterium]|nr:LPS export ABC transporter permease LptG [Rhodocyclaceae bacterium]
MKVLNRYLARQIYVSTFGVLLAFLGLFAFFDLLNELDNVGRDGYQLHHAMIYVLLILPGRVYELLPIAVLIGSLYALTNLARNSEITVMRASGLSTARALALLGGIGSVFVLLTFVFGEFIAPPAERAAQQWRLTVRNSTISQDLSSGLWVRDGKRFINVGVLKPDRTLEHVRIYEFDDGHALVAIADARHGVFTGSRGWRLSEVSRTRFLGDATDVERLDEIFWQSELTPEVLSVLMVVPERMSVRTLYKYVAHLRDNGQKSERYEIALWKKLAYPLAALVMMALALPFAYTHDRMGGVSLKVFLGVMLGVTFHLLNGLFSNLGVINAWPPVVAALTPSLLFLCAAGTMLWWFERR